MKPEETIFDGISDSEMESISGGIAEVQSESQSESAAGDGYAVKCCNNKLKQKTKKKSSRINGNVADLDVCKQSNIRGSLLKMKFPLILNYNKEILCYIR